MLTGNGTSPNLNGILKRLTDPTATASRMNEAKYIEAMVGALDGIHGTNLKDVRMLVGKTTFARMASLFWNSTAVSVAAYLEANTGGVRMSDRIPVVASNVQPGIVRVGMRSFCAVAPVWGGVQLIRDVYSSAGSGEVVVTALQLISDMQVLHSGAFAEVSIFP